MFELLKKTFLFIIIFLGLSALIIFIMVKTLQNPAYLSDNGVQNAKSSNATYADAIVNTTPDVPHVLAPVTNTENPQVKVVLAVPFINEAPDGNFSGKWKNACEEASMTMVEKYYLHEQKVSVSEAKTFMTMLFNFQDKIWGSDVNSDAARTKRIIDENTIYNGKIIDNPTVDQIKSELQQGRPIISPHYGFDLNNKNIPFLPASRGGTSYHMMVIIGYDDATKELITNDDGDQKAGASHRYGYDLFMGSIHDYSFADGKADGIPRVIFTYPKLVKMANDSNVYYLHDNIKQHVVDEATFKAKSWTWNMVNVVEKNWLDNFEAGADLKI
jgi:hypothetical protein